MMGPAEGVKTAVITGLRELFGRYGLTDLQLSLEYPVEKRQYPALMAQVPTSKVQRTAVDRGHSEPFTLGMMEGSLRLTVIALSNRERDQLADLLMSTLLFGSVDARNSLNAILSEGTFVHMTVSEDAVQSSQGTSKGTSWDPEQMVYTADLTLPYVAQFAAAIQGPELLKLTDVIVVGKMFDDNPSDDDW